MVRAYLSQAVAGVEDDGRQEGKEEYLRVKQELRGRKEHRVAVSAADTLDAWVGIYTVAPLLS